METTGPTIIDFFGAPGSGKTTVSRMVSKKLADEGYKVDEHIFQVNNEYNPLARILIKGMTAMGYTLKNFSFIKDIFSLAQVHTFSSWKTAVKQWVNVCFVMASLSRKRDQDIIIAEQGLTQAVISLALNCTPKNFAAIINKMEKHLSADIVYVHVRIGTAENLTRLKNRNEGNSEVELELDVRKREELLDKINAICDEIKTIKSCLTFDNTMEADSMEKFQQIIEKHLASQLKFGL